MALNTRLRKTLDWRTPAESLMTIYCCSNQAVLRRPLEPEQYTSTKLASLHMRQSLGRAGCCYDHALAESFLQPLRISGSIPSSIRHEIEPNKISPTTLKSSMISGGSTQRWATGHPHEVRTEYPNEQLAA